APENSLRFKVPIEAECLIEAANETATDVCSDGIVGLFDHPSNVVLLARWQAVVPGLKLHGYALASPLQPLLIVQDAVDDVADGVCKYLVEWHTYRAGRKLVH